MPSRLLACPACDRHVRASEPLCPFCGLELPATQAAGPVAVAPSTGLSRAALVRRGTRAAASALAGTAAIGWGASLLASACGDSPVQPDDGGQFVSYEGGHPMATMYGAPCDLDVDPNEHCCGEVAKEVPGNQCYGCLGDAAYALCVSGGFGCACTCDPPSGYSILTPDSGLMDCGSTEEASPAEGAPEETAPSDSGEDTLAEAAPEGSVDGSPDASLDASPPDASPDGPRDASPEADAGVATDAIADAPREGG
jgi:hypothetical protein